MVTHKARTAVPSPHPWAGFIAVRHSLDGTDWLDIATMSGIREVVDGLSAQTDAEIPSWAQANPVVAIRRCTLVLEEEML